MNRDFLKTVQLLNETPEERTMQLTTLRELQEYLDNEECKVRGMCSDEDGYHVELRWLFKVGGDEIDDKYILYGVIGSGETLDEAIEDALEKYKTNK